MYATISRLNYTDNIIYNHTETKPIDICNILCTSCDNESVYIRIIIKKKCTFKHYNGGWIDIKNFIKKNDVILSDLYNIYDIKTISIFNFKLTWIYIIHLCKLNRIDTLKYLYNNKNYKNQIIEIMKYQYDNNNNFIFHAGLEYGQLHCLEWFEENNIMPVEYYNESYVGILDTISINGFTHILDWFIHSGLKYGFKLKYSEDALKGASEYGYINVLEWWKNSGLPLKYDEHSIGYASETGKVAVLEWWKNSGLELKYNIYAIAYASGCGHVDVLEWWKQSGLELKYDTYALKLASKRGHIDVLEWWKNSGLELKYHDGVIIDTSVDVLEWWKNSGLPLKYSNDVIDYASETGRIKSLEWWKNSGLELKYSRIAIDHASKFDQISTLEWWKNSGLELKYSYRAFQECNPHTLKWWLESKLPIK